ncbi:MAG: DUF5998 family protein [Galactobacter sp.]
MAEHTADSRAALDADLSLTGFYPHLVSDLVAEELAETSVVSHLVQMETHVDRAEVHRHLTVLVLTSHDLVILHVDDQDPEGGSGRANVSAETVSLARVDSVVISSVYPEPDRYVAGSGPRELTLGVAWSGGQRLDVYSAACNDPQCEVDHGFTGQSVREDLLVRVSADADGSDRLAQARAFAKLLRAAAASAAQPRETSTARQEHQGRRGLVRSSRGDHR